MKSTLHRADTFNQDFDQQYRWYLREAGDQVAGRFLSAVESTLDLLLKQPELGRRRKFRNPALAEFRSYQVKTPFQKFLIFYRCVLDGLSAERLLHGARDLPRRLAEPPGT
jgi:plasmid stabilization system protein ParE